MLYYLKEEVSLLLLLRYYARFRRVRVPAVFLLNMEIHYNLKHPYIARRGEIFFLNAFALLLLQKSRGETGSF